MTQADPLTEDAGVLRTGIIDSDVHPSPRGVEEIRDYMPMPWRDRYQGGEGTNNGAPRLS